MEKLPKINIIYEDNHLLVVEKPVNIPVQRDNTKDIDLMSLLKDYRKKKENKPGEAYLGLVHRLDRPVGGIMVFAKTSKAASRLSEQIRTKVFGKSYLAVVKGTIIDNGVMEDYLVKDEDSNISYVTTSDKGKYAKLEYRVLNNKEDLSLVRINLVTGRSHQIRVQFSSRNYPLLGDSKYSSNPNNINIALFSESISFIHPTTKEKMVFKLDIPNRYPFNLFK